MSHPLEASIRRRAFPTPIRTQDPVNQADDTLTLTFPARSGYLRMCRITTTTFASDLGFDVDELDDLRLAVGEAATWLLLDDDGEGHVSFSMTAGAQQQIVVVGERHSDAIPQRDVDDLVHAILGATLDSYELTSNPGERSIALRKSKTNG